jgi:hypothetical protein
LAVRVIHPFVYLVKKFDSSFRMASCILLFGVGVECGICYDTELGEDEFLANGEDFCTSI